METKNEQYEEWALVYCNEGFTKVASDVSVQLGDKNQIKSKAHNTLCSNKPTKKLLFCKSIKNFKTAHEQSLDNSFGKSQKLEKLKLAQYYSPKNADWYGEPDKLSAESGIRGFRGSNRRDYYTNQHRITYSWNPTTPKKVIKTKNVNNANHKHTISNNFIELSTNKNSFGFKKVCRPIDLFRYDIQRLLSKLILYKPNHAVSLR